MSNEKMRQAVAKDTKQQKPIQVLSGFMAPRRDQIAQILPKHLDADRFVQLALYSYATNEDLQKCELRTVYESILLAARMGLEFTAGQAYLIPYKAKCSMVPGWQGLMDLVGRAGRATAWTGAVFDGDFFEYQLGARPDLIHRKGKESDPDKLLYVYAIGWVKGSDWPVIEVWDIDAVYDHRKKFNKVGDRHYSYKNWEMYARKIPLLQVIKYLPKSIELSNALAVSEGADVGARFVVDGKAVREDLDQDAGGDDAGGGPDPHAEKTSGQSADDQSGQGTQRDQAMTFNDAVAFVRDGAFDDARDVARTLGGNSLAMIDGMITQKKSSAGKSKMQLD